MRDLILLAVVIMVVGLLYLVLKWPQNHSKTFSQHAAAHKISIYYYLGLFLVVLPMLALFFFEYFIPTYSMSFIFSALVVVALITQLIVVIVPEVGGWKSQVHRSIVTISAAAILLILILLVFTPEISLFSRIISSFAAIVSIGLMISIIRYKTKHPYYLWVQIIFYTGFFGSVIAATYF